MERTPLDAIDSRIAFTAYAATVGAGGLFLFAWGDVWLGGPLFGNPWGLDTTVRVVGAVVMAAACTAFGASRIMDPVDRRRVLTWFVVAHTIVFAIVTQQAYVVWGRKIPATGYWIMTIVAAVWATLLAGWMRYRGDVRTGPLMYRLFGEPAHVMAVSLRSPYEEELRLAAVREERARLARDLHDSVKQHVFAIQTSAATAEVQLDTTSGGAGAAIARVREAARDAMTEMNALLNQLKTTPSENVGLIDSIRKLADACQLRAGADVEFVRDVLPPREEWPRGGHEAVFRAAQEALSNVARHARAQRVSVRLITRDRNVILIVDDDGLGFTTSDGHPGMGLQNVRSRITAIGGSVDIRSTPGAGTTLTTTVPCARHDRPSRRFALRTAGSAVLAIVYVYCIARGVAGRALWVILLGPILVDVTRYAVAAVRERRLSKDFA